MESTAAYLARKGQEIACLARLVQQEGRRPSSLPDMPLDNTGAVIAAKAALRAELIAREALAHPGLTETDWTKRGRHRVGCFRLSYGYARYDLTIDGPPIYPNLAARCGDGALRRVYCSSGMGAISATLLALARHRPGLRLLALRGSYFETRHLLDEFLPALPLTLVDGPKALRATLTSADEPAALWLDSYVAPNWHRLDRLDLPRAPYLLLVDSTCWSRRSRRTEALANWALRRRVPLVLLRSHLKLDSLGMEYGRLGSAVFLGFPDDILADTCRDVARTLGVGALPLLLPPFQGDARFQELSDQRLARLQENCRWLVARLRRSLPSRIGAYHHGLFLTLDPNAGQQAPPDIDSMTDLAEDLARHLRSRGLPAGHSGSFGFDFLAVDEYIEAMGERPVIRLALADLPGEAMERLYGAVLDWPGISRPGTGPPPAAAQG